MEQPWREYTTPEGRKYWHNGKTSSWTKPEALMSSAEKALSSSPWKEYTADGGRKYWYNTQTKETTWEIPQVFKDVQIQQPPSMPAKPPPPSFVAGGGFTHHHHSHRERGDHGPHERSASHAQSDGLRSNFVSAAPTTNEPDYQNLEEAEAVFMRLLKRSGVQPDWTWDQALKATVKDPQYRAIKDAKDRKAAFEKYVVESRIQDKEREKERMAKLREDFTKMLRSHPEIKYYTRWKTARPIIEGETIFRSTSDDTERRQLFEEYIVGLKRAHAEKQSSDRKAALEEMTTIMRSLNLEPYTRWSDAHVMINATERFKNDDKFKTLTKSDVLTGFDQHIKSLERSFNDTRQSEKAKKLRRERQNRDSFNNLLKELRSGGKIKAGTKWMEIQPLIEDDPRYVAMLGQSGSTPLDLFWDSVEDEERVLRQKRNEVLDVLDDRRFEITAKTPFEEFLSVMRQDQRTEPLDTHDLNLIFNRLHEKVIRREQEDKHQQERYQRRTIDALRSRIKHLEPAVYPSDSWEDVRPRVEKYDEYHALPTDDLRRSAFEKVIRRLKEKEQDTEHVDRYRRDHRDRRNGVPGSRHSYYSRTPEPDAYEADRKKAQADRERQYHKTSTTGLSPTPTESRRRDYRDRDERDRYDGRRSGRLVGRDYDRDYREREVRDYERERAYISRADPTEPPSRELDYGESGRTGSMSENGKKRRDSAMDEDGYDSGRRDSKRLKKEDRTPKESTPVKKVKEEENLRSGSEEGEIEED